VTKFNNYLCLNNFKTARATSNLVILKNPSIELQLALFADAMGVSYSRA